jgi:outer membrane protein OmpA-like peptidoglycan-associated protein
MKASKHAVSATGPSAWRPAALGALALAALAPCAGALASSSVSRTCLFDEDQHALRSDCAEEIRALAQDWRFVVAAHAARTQGDPAGRPRIHLTGRADLREADQALAERRVTAVQQALLTAGVPPNFVSIAVRGAEVRQPGTRRPAPDPSSRSVEMRLFILLREVVRPQATAPVPQPPANTD